MIRYVLMPEISKGKGTGHLVRSIDLATFLPDSALYIPEEQRSALVAGYPALSGLFLCGPEIFLNQPSQTERMFIVDKPVFSEVELAPLLELGLVAGIDLRGTALRRLPLLVDILPRLDVNRAWKRPNLHNSRFLKLPPKKRAASSTIKKILVAFGGEDHAELRLALIQSGILARQLPGTEIDLLSGPRMKQLNVPLPSGWKNLAPQPALFERLHEWDLVITSFGLTAYEASAAGCSVVLLNPSAYHQALAAVAGFPCFGIKKPSESRLRTALIGVSTNSVSPLQDTDTEASGPSGLASFIRSVQDLKVAACPACRSTGNRVLARFSERSFFSCRRCGIWYETLFTQQTIKYNEAYFFEEYEKQYGKTYLDDFSHIQEMGGQRLDRIGSLGFGKKGYRLLDIGCAYGPFLKAAADRGLDVQGSDISEDAVAWVQKNLGFPAQSGDIRQKSPEDFGGTMDIVSLWYVIEHFPDLYRLLHTLNALLRIGGLLALSTPSGSGISSLVRRLHFLDHSPRDHYTIWRPATVRRLLGLYGFRLRSIRFTGHHPERFPSPLSAPIFRPLSMLLSRLFGLGDTFELYAEKIKDLS